MDDRGTPINNCPMIGSEDIDLYRLFRAVYKLGGYNRVTNQNQWKLITRRLSFTMQNSPSTHNLVKQAYKKFLHSFEDFYRKLGCTMVNHPRGTIRKQRPGRSLIRDKDRNTPVPPQVSVAKTEKEEEDKKVMEDDKKEKKETKKEQVKEEEIIKIKKKDECEESGSGQESDVNVEGEAESSSSSEKSQKISTSLSLPNRGKSKSKEDPKKKVIEKKKIEPKKPEKKDDKAKEDEAAKTRSKSNDDTVKTKVSSENRETRTPSRESERKTLSKQRRLLDEELKKRGRKRKDYETEKSRSDEQLAESAPCYKGPVELGDRLKVYYGPTHESKVTYEAKVIDMEKDGSEPMYLVHYTGWNTRYDEWIKATRIAQNFTQAQGRVKRIKASSRPQTPSTNLSGSINKSSKIVSNATSSASQSRRRAQSVAPTTSVVSSTSAKDVKKEEKEKDKEVSSQPARSTTPLSVTSSSSRTKSPATPANNRQTRTRNNDASSIEHRRRTRRTSGHADIVPSETEESEAYDSDITESEPTRTKSKNTEERKRREARYRTEDRMKTDETSDGEEDKDNLEEPRRGRRLRRTISKSQGIKSEPDSDEEQPKGRDFDLNQIRSELKGFDKAVKLELVRVEPDPEDEIKIDEKDDVALASPKSEKSEPSKLEATPDTKIIDNTEDIYEFKEPEPFEFEVRNKRDTSGEKDKVKKRVFEDEPKSPKKKHKVVTSPVIKEVKVEADNDSRKKAKKIVSKRVDDIAESTPSHKPLQSTSLVTCEEAFDKLCELPPFSQGKPATIVEETGKISNGIDLLFSDLPGDDDGTRDDSEDRLIISEAEVSEAEQENLFTYQQEMFPSNDTTETVESPKEDTSSQNELVKEDLAPATSNKPDLPAEKKQPVKSPLHRQSPELKPLDSKLMDVTPVLSPIVSTPAPISARLPATSTIEEKLSAVMAFRNKCKDVKKDEEIPEVVWKPAKEIPKKLDPVVTSKSKEEQPATKVEIESKKREENVVISNENQCTEIMRVVIKQTDELQLKLKKDVEVKKFIETKIEHKKVSESDEEEWKQVVEGESSKKDDAEFTEHDLKEKDKEKHKKVINQDIVDSTDSSDSEQRLVIDNEESQDVKTPSNFDIKLRAELDRLQDTQERYSKLQAQKPAQPLKHQPQECIAEFKIESTPVIKTDEEGEAINSLLCEEEIPGSPAPISEGIEQINAGPSCSPPKVETAETSIVLMEMPFASAPTSGQSTTSSTVATLSMALPKTVEPSVPVSLPVQQNPSLGVRQQSHHQHLPALMPAQRRESNEAAPVMDNTPPTTPDSSISNISGSPREERTGGSSPTSEDNMKLNRDSSEADNDSGGKGPGFSEDDTLPNAEGNSADRILKPPAKRSVEESQSPKKRKRSRKHSECDKSGTKKSVRHSSRHGGRHGAGSDSDDTSEGSNLCGANSIPANHTNMTSVPDLSNYSSRSPRPTKYNFYVELGKMFIYFPIPRYFCGTICKRNINHLVSLQILNWMEVKG